MVPLTTNGIKHEAPPAVPVPGSVVMFRAHCALPRSSNNGTRRDGNMVNRKWLSSTGILAWDFKYAFAAADDIVANTYDPVIISACRL